MFRRFAEMALILKWPLLLGLLIWTVVTTVAMLQLQIDPSVETLFDKKSPEYRYYREFTEQYGSDQMIALAFSTPDLFRMTTLKKLRDLTREIGSFEQVERVLSLANAMDIRHKFLGVKVVPALEGVFEGERSLTELREDILSNELYVHNLVSKDGKTATILIYLKPYKNDRNSSGVFIRKLQDLLKNYENWGVKFYLAGAPIEQYEFIRLIRRDQFTFVPMITALLVITIFLIYRSISCMILAMSIVFTTLIWTMGTIVLVGQELNLVTSLLAPVIMIIAVANSIHLMNMFFEIRPHHPSLRMAVVLTIQQLGAPCFLTHVTAILGFLSLIVNPVPAIQSFGIFSAVGTLYSFIVSMLLTPLLLPILPYRGSVDSFDEAHFFNRLLIGFLEKFEFKWKWLIMIGIVFSIIFSVIGMSRLTVDTSLVKQMKPNSKVAIATRFIDEHLTGVYVLGFVLKRKDGGRINNYETLQEIDLFKNFLESMPEITKVNGITTVVKKLNEAKEGDKKGYLIPNNSGLLKRYFQGMAEANDPQLWTLVSHDFKEIRLEARMKAVGTSEGALVEESARQYLARHLSQTFDYRLTGNVVLLGRMAQDLVFHQMEGFGFAFITILVTITLIFRSVKMALLAAIPNILPIVAVYGFMGFANIELSTPTAMISSVVLGLVVDASIHFLYRFRIEFVMRHHYLQALHHTYRNVGQRLVVSTMILVAGFASSVFASFKPTIHFGLLTSCTIFFGLICTLMILPLFLVMFRPFGRPKLFMQPVAR